MASNQNTYELTYIVNSVISDNQIQDLIKRVSTYVTENGGEVIDVDQWGSRRLAFPIMKKRNGFYVNVYFRAPGSIILRLERALEIDDNVLRYLTMKMDAKMLRHYTAQKAVRTTFAPVEDKPKSDSRTRNRSDKSDGAGAKKDADSKTEKPSVESGKEKTEPDAGESKPVKAEAATEAAAEAATVAAPETAEEAAAETAEETAPAKAEAAPEAAEEATAETAEETAPATAEEVAEEAPEEDGEAPKADEEEAVVSDDNKDVDAPTAETEEVETDASEEIPVTKDGKTTTKAEGAEA